MVSIIPVGIPFFQPFWLVLMGNQKENRSYFGGQWQAGHGTDRDPSVFLLGMFEVDIGPLQIIRSGVSFCLSPVFRDRMARCRHVYRSAHHAMGTRYSARLLAFQEPRRNPRQAWTPYTKMEQRVWDQVKLESGNCGSFNMAAGWIGTFCCVWAPVQNQLGCLHKGNP